MTDLIGSYVSRSHSNYTLWSVVSEDPRVQLMGIFSPSGFSAGLLDCSIVSSNNYHRALSSKKCRTQG